MLECLVAFFGLVEFTADDQSRGFNFAGHFRRPAKTRSCPAAHHSFGRPPAGADAIPLHDPFPEFIADAGFHLARAPHVRIPTVLFEIIPSLKTNWEIRQPLLYWSCRWRAWRVEYYPI